MAVSILLFSFLLSSRALLAVTNTFFDSRFSICESAVRIDEARCIDRFLWRSLIKAFVILFSSFEGASFAISQKASAYSIAIECFIFKASLLFLLLSACLPFLPRLRQKHARL